MRLRRYRRVPQRTIDAANEFVRRALAPQGRVQVKVDRSLILDLNIWALLALHQLHSGVRVTSGAVVQVFIDGKEIPKPAGMEE